ncbi:MAG: Cna B-type domain-containing protein [Firmicutes bacterium]|nr:Cna B-type domain-containing protein [Bacillota bacterium]
MNKDVHADIVNFDQDFTYDIMAYVPIMAKEFTVSDTLVPGLEFANKDGNAVANKSTIEKISVKTINDHKPDGTVSQAGMPDSEGKEIDLTSGNADIQINGNKLVVKIDENTYYKNKNDVNKNALAELRGRWVQVTFHARIKDEYRNIDALKALTYGDNKNSWLNDEVNKYSDQRHEATFANGDLVLADALFKQFSLGPDPIIWAVEGPSRLFAKTASGDYYATPMNDKTGSVWNKLENGSADWNNANNRYNGTPPEANNTRRALDTEGDDKGLVAALKEMPLIKGAQLGKGAEGQERIFIEVYNPKAVSDGNTSGYEIYATTSDDHKSGRLWEKLEPGSTAYNNGEERLKNDRYTLRMLDFVSESIILSEGGKNWPVITQQTHEGMSNQSSYDVIFGNDSVASYRSNIVTVEPETTEIDVAKKWAPDNKWPAGVDSVTLTVYALNKQNDEKTVYVDEDGKVVGIFAKGATIPDKAKPLTVELKPDDPDTEDVDESKATIKDLPRLKNTVYTARETKINDEEIVYKDNGIATTTLGDSKIVTTNTAGYKGDGKKFESLRDSKGVKVVRGAIADNRLWAIALNGNYYVTEVNDTDGSGEWKKLDKPAENADSESDAVKIYDRAQKLLGIIDSQGRFTAVKDEELDNDKIEDLDQPIGTPTETKVFDIIPSVTATNSTSSIEKYVNDDVHDDLGEFDKAFKYDILVYVPAGSTELTITDPLRDGVLEFAKKKDSLDAAKQTSAEKAETADETIAAVVAKDKNDHTANSTVAGKDSDNEGTDITSKISGKSIEDNTLTIKFEGKADTEHEGNKLPLDFAGKWVQVTFWAKYTDEIIRAADAGDFKKIRENGAVISEKYPNVAQDAAEDEFSHEGTVNKASATISVGNDYNFDLASNEVTVKPETEKLWVQKKWQNEEGEELSKWPKGLTVKINVYKNAKGSEAEVVETLEVSSFEPVSSKTYPKLVGVTYSVDEVEVPEKYAKLDEITGDGSEEKPFVITNAARKYTGAEITKKWVGATMDEIPSGEDFKTYLVLKDGEGKDVSEEYADKLTVTTKGSTYKAKWVGLPDGKYTVEEKAIPGFDTEVNGSTITNKKKPSGEKPEIEKYVNQAVHKDITLDEVFTYDIIAYVTKDADSVTITDKLHDMLTFDGDASHVAVVDLGEADNHLVTNNIAGVEVNKNASVAQKGKPVEGAKVEINGQTLKVFITNKLKKTTAKGEDVYTPVEIESVNPKEKGYYELIEDEYVLTEDTAPAVDKTYYVMETPEESDSQPSFSAVNIETVNPSEKGYYEYSSYEYVPTKDERPDPDTTYYVKAEGQVEEADGYEYDGENQPVTALRGQWLTVTFNAKIHGKTLEEVKKKYEYIKASDVDDSRDPENIGNAPVVSVEDHTGLPNDASYTIGVANEAGIQEDVYKDKSNIVTVKPKEKKKDKPGTDGEDNSGKSDKGTDGEDDRPDADLGTKKPAQNSAGKKSAATGDDVQLGVAIAGLMCAIAVLEILRRRRKAK